MAPNGDVCRAPQVRAGPQHEVAHEGDAKLHLVTVALLVLGLVEQLSRWEVGGLRDEDRESVNESPASSAFPSVFAGQPADRYDSYYPNSRGNKSRITPSYHGALPQLSPLPVPEAHGNGVRTPPPRLSLPRHPSPVSVAPSANLPPLQRLTFACAHAARGAVETWRRRYGRFFQRMSRCGSC